ncbi:MAG: hypothetical protein RMM17_04830 [Acidobacteriota bacterium]|nr:hypothetical protein [Blastocatellia bacterium]MDW8411988.1 hypothetical protein [Acidobacteriota bacterium]
MSETDKGIKDILKQAFESWQKMTSEHVEQLVRSQTFLSAIAQNIEQTLNISDRVKDITQTTMGMMNLPTKRDLDNLAKQIRSIKISLEEINERLEDISKQLNLASKTTSEATAKSEQPRPKKSRAKKTAES